MAYPVVESYTSGQSAGNQTSTTITIPSGTTSGDTLFLFFSKDGSSAPINLSDGFTGLVGSADSGNASYFQIYYKRLTATQNSFTIGHDSQGTSWILIRISSNVVIASSSVAQGASNSPNSPSLTSNFDTGTETLWISAASWDYNRSVSSFPSNFTSNNISQLPSSSGGASTAIATLNSTNASEDPSNFTISNSDTWNAYTLALRIRLVTTKTVTTTLNLTGAFNIDLSGYHIERKITSSGTWSEIDVDDASSYVDSYAFSNGVTYYYRIRLLGSNGFSNYSREVSVTYVESGSTEYKTVSALIDLTISHNKQGKKIIHEILSSMVPVKLKAVNKHLTLETINASEFLTKFNTQLIEADVTISNTMLHILQYNKTLTALAELTGINKKEVKKAINELLDATTFSKKDTTKQINEQLQSDAALTDSTTKTFSKIVDALGLTQKESNKVIDMIIMLQSIVSLLSGKTLSVKQNVTASTQKNIFRFFTELVSLTTSFLANFIQGLIQKALSTTVNVATAIEKQTQKIYFSAINTFTEMMKQGRKDVITTLSLALTFVKKTFKNMLGISTATSTNQKSTESHKSTTIYTHYVINKIKVYLRTIVAIAKTLPIKIASTFRTVMAETEVSGNAIKQTGRTFKTDTEVQTDASRQTGKVATIVTYIHSTVEYMKVSLKMLLSVVTGTAQITKNITHTLTSKVHAFISALKKPNKSLEASSTVQTNMTKNTKKVTTVVNYVRGILDYMNVFMKTLLAVVTGAVTTTKSITRTLVSGVQTIGIALKNTVRDFATAVSIAGTKLVVIGKAVFSTVLASISFLAEKLTNAVFKTLVTSVNALGGLQKIVIKYIDQILNTTTSLVRTVRKAVNSVIHQTGLIFKSIAWFRSSTVLISRVAIRKISKSMVETLQIAGFNLKKVLVSLAGRVSQSSSIVRNSVRTFVTSVSSLGTSVTTRLKELVVKVVANVTYSYYFGLVYFKELIASSVLLQGSRTYVRVLIKNIYLLGSKILNWFLHGSFTSTMVGSTFHEFNLIGSIVETSVQGDYEEIYLTGGIDVAELNQDATIVAGDSARLNYTISTDGSIVGSYVTFQLFDRTDMLFVKDTISGITIVDATSLYVDLDHTDTTSLIGKYKYELELLDSFGKHFTVAQGTITVLKNRGI